MPCAIQRYLSFIFAAALIILATAAVYAPVFEAGFIWDDDIHVTKNPLTLPDGLRRVWFSSRQINYWPITWSAFWIEWRLWGRNFHPYHVVNALAHAMTAILLWLLLAKLKAPGSWLVALIFSIHPVNVETAAWISQLKNILSFALFIMAILCYLKFEDGRRKRWYVLSIMAFVMAMMAKPAAVILPVVLLAIAWWRRNRLDWKDALRAAPFFILAIAATLVEVSFQGRAEVDRIRPEPPLSRIIGAEMAVWFYLGKALFPVNLNFRYPRWNLDEAAWISYLPVMALCAIAAALWLKRNVWGKPFAFAGAYYVCALAPALGFANILYFRYSFVSDHYQYMAIAGLIALIVGIGWNAAKRTARPLQFAAMGAAIIAALACASMSWKQAHIYRSQRTIWRDNIIKHPESSIALYNYGVLLSEASTYELARKYYDDAIKFWPVYTGPGSLDLRRSLAGAHTNRANILQKWKLIDDAIKEYQTAIEIWEYALKPRANLAVAYWAKEDKESAMRVIEETLSMAAKTAEDMRAKQEAHIQLGVIYAANGEIARALEEYKRAITIDSSNFNAWLNRGALYYNAKEYAAAVYDLTQTIKLNPELKDAYYFRAACFNKLGESNKAGQDIERLNYLMKRESAIK